MRKFFRLSAKASLVLLAGAGCLVWTGNRTPNWNDSRNWYDTNTGTTSTHPPGPQDDVFFTGDYVRNCNISGAASARSVTVLSGYTGRLNLVGSLDTNSLNMQSGTLRIAAGARLILGGGQSLVLGPGTSLEVSGTAQSKSLIAAREGEFFSAELAGNVSITNAIIRNVSSGGLTLSGGAGQTASLSNTAFENLQDPSAFYLRIVGAAWAQANLSGLSFQDVGPGPHTTNTVYLDIPDMSTYVQLTNFASESPPYSAGEGTSAEAPDDYVVWGPLAVSLGRCAAWRGASGVELAWETLSERANAGFYIERAYDASGPWERLAHGLVPGAGSSKRRRVYIRPDPTAPPGGEIFYRIVDVDLAGRQEPHEAFGLTEGPPEWLAVKSKIDRRASAVRHAGPRAPQAKSGTSARWRILTDGEGVFWLSGAELAAMGLGPEEVFALSSEERPIAYVRWGGGIAFYAEAWRTRHTGLNVTFLEAGKTHQLPQSPAGSPKPLALPIRLRVRIEENAYYYPYYTTISCPAGEEPWYSDELAEPGQLWARTVELGELAGGDARLRFRLVGYSADPTLYPDHRVLILVNGNVVGEAAWDGFASSTGELSVPAGMLSPGVNELALKPLELGESWNWVLVDWLELEYEAPPLAQDDYFALDIPPGASGALSVGGFTSEEIYVFRNDRTGTSLVSCDISAEGGGRFRASIRATGGGSGARYVFATPSAFRSVSRFDYVPASELKRQRGAYSYIIVAPREFRQAAELLAAHRSGKGQSVLIADYEAVCDEFSFGRAGPEAIRELVRWHRPRYLLLLGDATYDPMDFSGASERDFVPAFFTTDRTSEILSDEPFSCPEGRPEVAVGRLPARSAEEALALVAKVISAESKPQGSDPAVFVSDDDKPVYSSTCDEAALALGGPFEKIYLGRGFDGSSARAALHAAASAGARTVFYMGHGGTDRIAAENLLSSEDAPLFAQGRPTQVISLSCLNAAFDGYGGESLGEALLRAEGAGAWAFVGSAGFSDEGAQSVFGIELARELGRATRLGDAVMLAKRALPSGASDVRRTFQLLGDPASECSGEILFRLISPNGSERIMPGEDVSILWLWNGDVGPSVSIEFSPDGGASWQVLVEDAPNTGSYRWKVPECRSEDCLMRVRSAGGFEDVSDARFVISPASAGTSPSGGGCAAAASPHPAQLAVVLISLLCLALRRKGGPHP